MDYIGTTGKVHSLHPQPWVKISLRRQLSSILQKLIRLGSVKIQWLLYCVEDCSPSFTSTVESNRKPWDPILYSILFLINELVEEVNGTIVILQKKQLRL